MAKERSRFSCSLLDTVITSINNIASKKGQTVSYITNKYMIDGLRNEKELTDAERYMWSMTRITETIDNLLRIAKINHFNGNIRESMLLLSSILILDKGYFESTTSYTKYRYSFFEVLDELAKVDKPLIDELSVLLSEIQKKLKSSENSEELILFGNFRISEDTATKNTINNECDISESEHNQELEELSDEDKNTIQRYKNQNRRESNKK